LQTRTWPTVTNQQKENKEKTHENKIGIFALKPNPAQHFAGLMTNAGLSMFFYKKNHGIITITMQN
jgi:hypothetical protein